MSSISKIISSFARFIWRFRVEVLLFLLVIPAIKDLLGPGFFPMHDDLQVFRLFEFNKCILDGQIPCRWVPDAGFGYGYPLMQFYPPMPYYPMELLLLLGMGLFWPVKIMFAAAFVFSALGMYLLAREFFGKWGGVLSAILYVYAPYHSVDIYVRGALNEAWGMVWFPFVLLYIYRLIKTDSTKKNIAVLGLVLSLQLTSHNVMTLALVPSAVVWALFWIWREKKIHSTLPLIYSGLLGVGLAAFFFIPVVLEQKFVHVDSMIVGYFNYLAHFADINQLFFSRFWGYGGSTWGPEDGMSFSIGHIQWIGAVIAAAIAFFSLISGKKKQPYISVISSKVEKSPSTSSSREAISNRQSNTVQLMIILLLVFGFGYAFLTHARSVFIWDRVSVLHFAQFPWRLVALIVFYFSFAGGYLATIRMPKVFKSILFSIAIISIILFNVEFFRVERHTRITREEKLSGLQWELQVTGGIFDYLPRSAPKPPGSPGFTIPQYVEGYGGIVNFESGSNWMSFAAHVSSDSARIMLPLYTYPGLVTTLDGEEVETAQDIHLGRVLVDVPAGLHSIEARIGYTATRLISDILTVVSIVILLKILSDARKRTS